MDFLHHKNLHRISPADLELERRFIHRLTPRTKRLRLLAAFGEPSDAQLVRLVSPNPHTELALAWVQKSVPQMSAELDGEFAAVARYAVLEGDSGVAEFAIVVADELQAQGIGRKLLIALIAAAQAARLSLLQGDCYADNRALIALCEGLGFVIDSHPEDASLVRVSLSLIAKGTHPEYHTRYQ
jgi:acetyltransferase